MVQGCHFQHCFVSFALCHFFLGSSSVSANITWFLFAPNPWIVQAPTFLVISPWFTSGPITSLPGSIPCRISKKCPFQASYLFLSPRSFHSSLQVSQRIQTPSTIHPQSWALHSEVRLPRENKSFLLIWSMLKRRAMCSSITALPVTDIH